VSERAQRGLGMFNSAFVSTVHGVVFEQVRHVIWFKKGVVDCYELDVSGAG
jgi:hypothetical protein